MIALLLSQFAGSKLAKYALGAAAILALVAGAYFVVVKHDQNVAEKAKQAVVIDVFKDENKRLADDKAKGEVSNTQDIKAIVDNNNAANANNAKAQDIKSDMDKKIEAAKKQKAPSVDLTNNASPVSDAGSHAGGIKVPQKALADTVSEIRITAIWQSYCSGSSDEPECKGDTT